ncbi:hypothetical protein K1719_040536 [Acacia pycnantha]|nr:hypothetical protein K1719_040536 [Acacia pycnantha]
MGSSRVSWKLPDHPKLPKGKQVVVVVLDGWGEANPNEYNLGLPSEDDMGNSEVNHNALGAGRIFAQG